MEQVFYAISLPMQRLGQPFKDLARHLHDHFIPHARNNYHPHILGHRALGLFSAFLVCTKVCVLILLTAGPVLPAYSSAITGTNIISLTNASRESFSLPDLKENSLLDVAAQAKANDMLAKGYFAHVTPDGKTPWDFIVAAGYNYITAGENLAVNFTEAESVETAWMNSPEHKANLLNKNFEDIGVGISQGEYEGHTAIFVVQEFGTLAAQKIAISNVPTKVAPKTATAPDQLAPTPTAPAPAVRALATQVPAPTPTPAPVINVQSAQVSLVGSSVQISAQVSDGAVKVIAYFGDKAIMLDPRGSGQWQGQVLASDLVSGNSSVYVRAEDINGKTVDLHLADFSNSIAANYNVVSGPGQPSSFVNFYGKIIDPKNLEQRIYLLFIAAILTCLIIAIAIKRHVQHLPMIANASLTVMVAALLYMVH